MKTAGEEIGTESGEKGMKEKIGEKREAERQKNKKPVGRVKW